MLLRRWRHKWFAVSRMTFVCVGLDRMVPTCSYDTSVVLYLYFFVFSRQCVWKTVIVNYLLREATIFEVLGVVACSSNNIVLICFVLVGLVLLIGWEARDALVEVVAINFVTAKKTNQLSLVDRPRRVKDGTDMLTWGYGKLTSIKTKLLSLQLDSHWTK